MFLWPEMNIDPNIYNRHKVLKFMFIQKYVYQQFVIRSFFKTNKRKMDKKLIIIIYPFLVSLKLYCQEVVPFERFGLWGYKDDKGDEIISPQYQYAAKFIENFAVVALNDSKGVIDKNNNVVVSLRYDFIRYIGNGMFQFGRREKYFGEYKMGIISKENEVIIKPEFSYIAFENGFYHVQTKTDSVIGQNDVGDIRISRVKHGLFNSMGTEVIPCNFDFLKWRGNSLIVLTYGVNQALFNPKGEQLTAFKYMVIDEFVNGLSKVREGNQYGYIKSNGEIGIPVQFDSCTSFFKGIALVKIGEGWGAINTKGEIVIETNLTFSEVKEEIEKRMK